MRKVLDTEPKAKPECLDLEEWDGRLALRKRAASVGMQETMMPMVISTSLYEF